ncbi:MAG: hypothetical protein KDD67_09640 [Ignavibacteriae bacterium]|nr:hypothetical protein [Ignavibacteriota bacterium]
MAHIITKQQSYEAQQTLSPRLTLHGFLFSVPLRAQIESKDVNLDQVEGFFATIKKAKGETLASTLQNWVLLQGVFRMIAIVNYARMVDFDISLYRKNSTNLTAPKGLPIPGRGCQSSEEKRS